MLWLNGYSVGTFEDSSDLRVACYELIEFFKHSETSCYPDFDNLGKEEVLDKVKGENAGEHYQFICLGDNFDDFNIFVYLTNNRFRFIWKLHEYPFFNYINYSNGTLETFVEKNICIKVVNDFCLDASLWDK